MADIFSKEKRSQIMSRIRSKGTKIENVFEQKLKENKIKYKLHGDMEGKPDFVFEEEKIAVFLDGEFWHGRLWKKRGQVPKSDYWKEKLERNMKRDAKVNRILRKEGWTVMRFWESDILKNPDYCIEKLMKRM